MRIISSTFGAISNVFDSINAVAQLASDTAEQGLNSLRRETEMNKQLEQDTLATRISNKKVELLEENMRISKKLEKLQQDSMFKKAQINLLKTKIEIEEFRIQKEMNPEERLAALKEKLSRLEGQPASSIEEVKVVDK